MSKIYNINYTDKRLDETCYQDHIISINLDKIAKIEAYKRKEEDEFSVPYWKIIFYYDCDIVNDEIIYNNEEDFQNDYVTIMMLWKFGNLCL